MTYTHQRIEVIYNYASPRASSGEVSEPFLRPNAFFFQAFAFHQLLPVTCRSSPWSSFTTQKKKKKVGDRKLYLLRQQTEIELIFEIAAELLEITMSWVAKEAPVAHVAVLSGPCRLSSRCIIPRAFQCSQGISGPTVRSRVNCLYFSCVSLSILLLWKPHLTSLLNLCDCSSASVTVNKNIRLLSILLLATSCQQSTNSLVESFGTLAWLFMQSIARLVCIHNCLILWPLL